MVFHFINEKLYAVYMSVTTHKNRLINNKTTCLSLMHRIKCEKDSSTWTLTLALEARLGWNNKMQYLAYPKVTPLYSSCCNSWSLQHESLRTLDHTKSLLSLSLSSLGWHEVLYFFVLRRRSGWKWTGVGTDPVEPSLFISIVLAGGFVRRSIRGGCCLWALWEC